MSDQDLIQQAIKELGINVPIRRSEVHAGHVKLWIGKPEPIEWWDKSAPPSTEKPKRSRRKQ